MALLPLDASVEWLTIRMAARYASLSRETIRRAARVKHLRVVYVGRSMRTRRAWIDAWLEQRVSGGAVSVDEQRAAS